MSQNNRNTWTKWWWLRVDHVKQWSIGERRAGRVLAFTFAGLLLFALAATFVLLMVLKLGVTQGVAASIPISVTLTLIFARGIANDMFSGVVQAGDAAAAERLGGWIPDPTDTPPSLWWLDYEVTGRCSPEEYWTRNVIFAIAAVLFLAPLAFELQTLKAFGIGKGTSALVLVLVVLPLTLYLSRRFCVWMWPEYVKRADALAHQRETRQNQNKCDKRDA
jgi:hypothetical protein